MTSKYRCPVCGESTGSDGLNTTVNCKSCGWTGTLGYAITLNAATGNGTYAVTQLDEADAALTTGQYAGLGQRLKIVATPSAHNITLTIAVVHTTTGRATETYTNVDSVIVDVDGAMSIDVTFEAQITVTDTFAHGNVTVTGKVSGVSTAVTLASTVASYFDRNQTLVFSYVADSGYTFGFGKVSTTYYMEETNSVAVTTGNLTMTTTFIANTSLDSNDLTIQINLTAAAAVQSWATAISGGKAVASRTVSTDKKRCRTLMAA